MFNKEIFQDFKSHVHWGAVCAVFFCTLFLCVLGFLFFDIDLLTTIGCFESVILAFIGIPLCRIYFNSVAKNVLRNQANF